MGKQFEPMLTSGNEPFVHHISIYACSHPNPILLEQYLKNEGSDCTDSANMPKDFAHCFQPYFMWAIGGGAFHLPKDVGFPLGDENSHTFVLLNIHYDNPERIEGTIDSSGVDPRCNRQGLSRSSDRGVPDFETGERRLHHRT